jgi:hypothetical protein
VIGERRAAAKIDRAFGPRRDLLAILADDVEFGGGGLADRALVGQPVMRADVAEAVALAAGVVIRG